VIEKQGRFFNAWGCFADSRFPGPPVMVRRRRDVSRETTFSSAAMFHVKHFCVIRASA
jgi:hypothetical protein